MTTSRYGAMVCLARNAHEFPIPPKKSRRTYLPSFQKKPENLPFNIFFSCHSVMSPLSLVMLANRARISLSLPGPGVGRKHLLCTSSVSWRLSKPLFTIVSRTFSREGFIPNIPDNKIDLIEKPPTHTACQNILASVDSAPKLLGSVKLRTDIGYPWLIRCNYFMQ